MQKKNFLPSPHFTTCRPVKISDSGWAAAKRKKALVSSSKIKLNKSWRPKKIASLSPEFVRSHFLVRVKCFSSEMFTSRVKSETSLTKKVEKERSDVDFRENNDVANWDTSSLMALLEPNKKAGTLYEVFMALKEKERWGKGRDKKSLLDLQCSGDNRLTERLS